MGSVAEPEFAQDRCDVRLDDASQKYSRWPISVVERLAAISGRAGCLTLSEFSSSRERGTRIAAYSPPSVPPTVKCGGW
jgi:hypothetical protein